MGGFALVKTYTPEGPWEKAVGQLGGEIIVKQPQPTLVQLAVANTLTGSAARHWEPPATTVRARTRCEGHISSSFRASKIINPADRIIMIEVTQQTRPGQLERGAIDPSPLLPQPVSPLKPEPLPALQPQPLPHRPQPPGPPLQHQLPLLTAPSGKRHLPYPPWDPTRPKDQLRRRRLLLPRRSVGETLPPTGPLSHLPPSQHYPHLQRPTSRPRQTAVTLEFGRHHAAVRVSHPLTSSLQSASQSASHHLPFV